MRINKFIFQDFNDNIVNYNYLKSIPFCTFSDNPSQDYNLIKEVLEGIGYDINKLVSIGKKVAPYGVSINPSEIEDKNQLLNSCQFSLVFGYSLKDSEYLITSVLAGIIPICNNQHPFIKQMGLKYFSTSINKTNILDLLRKHMYYQHIVMNKIYWLSWNYHNQIQKWKNK